MRAGVPGPRLRYPGVWPPGENLLELKTFRKTGSDRKQSSGGKLRDLGFEGSERAQRLFHLLKGVTDLGTSFTIT